MPNRVLVTDHAFDSLDEFHAVLDPLGVSLDVSPASDEATLVEEVRSASALVVVYAKITEPVIAAAAEGGCRVIARTGIGYDNIDVEAATRHGVQVTNVPDYCLDEVADHTMALLLACARGVVPAILAVREGAWAVPDAPIHRLQGRRLAVIGMGGIGRRVAARALAFGLEVVAFDPYVKEPGVGGTARASSLDEAVAEADCVTLHVPLARETHHLIGETLLAVMRRAPWLVNTARGGLLDLEAATEALDHGRISGLALDVTEMEPLPGDHPLRRHPRVLLTPHMAYYSQESAVELKQRVAEEVARALRGESPRCPVNRLEVRPVG